MTNIVTRLNNVMQDIGGVAKTQRVTIKDGPNYAFRGIDQFMQAVQPALIANGVVVYPNVQSYETTKDGKAIHAIVHVAYHFVSEDAEFNTLVSSTMGEAKDWGDKAMSKAMSQAFKYALMQALCIPLEGEPDADQGTPVPEWEHLGWSDEKTQKDTLRELNAATKRLVDRLGKEHEGSVQVKTMRDEYEWPHVSPGQAGEISELLDEWIHVETAGDEA